MYKLNINGKSHSVDVPADMPLLWVIRDVVGLKGTKFGCGIGQCGACTLHIDGASARACGVSVGDAAGHKITTIEGLHPQGRHPLQLAWIGEQAPQCGYCQPGQIMQAAALLAQKPKATDAEIVEAMKGNLCRCAAYIRIKRAIKRVVREA